eukprot:m.199447 g.199447  ORF g.199447 m.199447 type:complete len:84 (+) comp13697_c1_seq2:1428-1679(+)
MCSNTIDASPSLLFERPSSPTVSKHPLPAVSTNITGLLLFRERDPNQQGDVAQLFQRVEDGCCKDGQKTNLELQSSCDIACRA